MSSRRRITVALVGLIALVVVGWLVRGYAGASQWTPQGVAARPGVCLHQPAQTAPLAGTPSCVLPLAAADSDL